MSGGSWMRLAAAIALVVVAVGSAAAQDGKAVVFRWRAIDGAASYQVQIAEDRQFTRVVIDERTVDTRYSWKKLGTRSYFWRVRAIDADGKEGSYSRPRRLDAVVGPPRLLAPRPGTRIPVSPAGDELPVVKLSWQGSPLLSTYVVEIAADPRFEHVVRRETTVDTEVPFRPRRAGQYHWRVSALDVNGQTVSAGKARGFSVTLPAPEPAPTRSLSRWKESTRLRLAWRAGGDIASFQVEIAGPGGTRYHRATGSPYHYRPPRPGRYRWRVRARDPMSAWSRYQVVSVGLRAPGGLQATTRPEASQPGAAMPTDIRWKPVAGATGYRVRISGDGLSKVSETTETQVTVPVPPGDHSVTVEALFGEASSPPSESLELAVRSESASASRTRVTAETVPPQRDDDGRLWLGPRLGLFYNLGELAAPSIGVEAEYGLPKLPLSGLRAMASVGYMTDSTAVADPMATVDSRLHGMSLRAGASLRRRFDAITLRASAALALMWLRMSVSGDLEGGVTAARPGVVGTLGAEGRVGPGSVFFDLEWSEVASVDEVVRVDPDGPAVMTGYRIAVF